MSELPHRRLGATGPLVSVVGIGCNNFGRPGTVTASFEGTRTVVDAAISAGITLFDTAEMYGEPPGTSELLLGEALRKYDRSAVVLATKWGHQAAHAHGAVTWGPKGARKYIRNAVQASLRRLQTDYIDLYQLHTPDPATEIDETLGVLDELVTEGVVRHIGHSNLSGPQITQADQAAARNGLQPFISAQNDYSLLNRQVEVDVLPAVERAAMGFLPYYPLANGLLTGKYTQHHSPSGTRLVDIKPQLLERADWGRLQAFQKLCDDAGLTMLQAAFGWLLSRGMLASVIAGATNAEQVHANAAAGRTELSTDVLAAIDKIFPPPGTSR